MFLSQQVWEITLLAVPARPDATLPADMDQPIEQRFQVRYSIALTSLIAIDSTILAIRRLGFATAAADA